MSLINFVLISIIILIVIYYNWDKLRLYFKKAVQSKPKKVEIKAKLTKVNNLKNEFNNDLNNYINNLGLSNKLKKMVHESLDDGKRLRPIITISVYKKLSSGVNIKLIKDFAIGLEIIHSISLVFDDLMDKDTERRGVECFYLKHGVSYTILVSLYLLTDVLKYLSNSLINSDLDKDMSLKLFSLLFNKLRELSLGQYMDLELPKGGEDKNFDKKLKKMINNKTSTLFELSFLFPWLVHHKTFNENDSGEVSKMAQSFGMIYQIADDFEDVEQDKKNGSVMNYVISRGYTQARIDYYGYVDHFKRTAKYYGMYNEELNEIITYLNTKIETYYKLK